MKTRTTVLLIMVSAFAWSSGYSQTGTSPSNSAMQGQEPRTLSDPTMSTRLSNDLNTRNSQIGNNTVNWFDSGNGYYGTYSVGDTKYMTRYDQKGNYQQTYTQSEWNNNVPANLRSSFDKSEYKGQNVTGYWTTNDPGQKGYYLEVQGKDGKTSRVYSDDKGKFSTSPGKNGSSKKPN